MIAKRTPVVLTFIMAWLFTASLAQASVLQDMQGQVKTINDYAGKGKWLVVMIWASDCHICNQEAHAYVDFQFAHSDEDAEVLGITVDGQARKVEAEKFIERHKVNFPNLIGEPQAVSQLYTELTGAQFIGTPAFLFYNPKGELVAQQVGAVPTDLIEEFIREQSVVTAKTP